MVIFSCQVAAETRGLILENTEISGYSTAGHKKSVCPLFPCRPVQKKINDLEKRIQTMQDDAGLLICNVGVKKKANKEMQLC